MFGDIRDTGFKMSLKMSILHHLMRFIRLFSCWSPIRSKRRRVTVDSGSQQCQTSVSGGLRENGSTEISVIVDNSLLDRRINVKTTDSPTAVSSNDCETSSVSVETTTSACANENLEEEKTCVQEEVLSSNQKEVSQPSLVLSVKNSSLESSKSIVSPLEVTEDLGERTCHGEGVSALSHKSGSSDCFTNDVIGGHELNGSRKVSNSTACTSSPEIVLGDQISTDFKVKHQNFLPEESYASKNSKGLSLYVGDLCPTLSEQELQEFFSTFGEVISVKICRDMVTKASLLYGYVNFRKRDDGLKALEEANYTSIKGKICRIMIDMKDSDNLIDYKANLKITNLPLSFSHRQMHALFSSFGKVLSCKVVYDQNGMSKGVGFVQFLRREDSDRALNETNGLKIEDCVLTVVKHLHDSSDEVRERTIHVRNISIELAQVDVKEMFELMGKIESIHLRKIEKLNTSWAVITYKSSQSASKAVCTFNGKFIKGNMVSVTVLKASSEEPRVDALFIANLPPSTPDNDVRILNFLHRTLASFDTMKIQRSSFNDLWMVCFDHRFVNEMSLKREISNLCYNSVKLAAVKLVSARQASMQNFISKVPSIPVVTSADRRGLLSDNNFCGAQNYYPVYRPGVSQYTHNMMNMPFTQMNNLSTSSMPPVDSFRKQGWKYPKVGTIHRGIQDKNIGWKVITPERSYMGNSTSQVPHASSRVDNAAEIRSKPIGQKISNKGQNKPLLMGNDENLYPVDMMKPQAVDSSLQSRKSTTTSTLHSGTRDTNSLVSKKVGKKSNALLKKLIQQLTVFAKETIPADCLGSLPSVRSVDNETFYQLLARDTINSFWSRRLAALEELLLKNNDEKINVLLPQLKITLERRSG